MCALQSGRTKRPKREPGHNNIDNGDGCVDIKKFEPRTLNHLTIVYFCTIQFTRIPHAIDRYT